MVGENAQGPLSLPYTRRNLRPSLLGGLGHRAGARESYSPLPPSTNPRATHERRETDTRLQVTGLQSAEIPRFSGIGVGVIKGSLQVRSGLAL